MVKIIDLQTFIPSCSAQRFYDLVYAGDKPMQLYHRLVNKDPAAQVSRWDNGVRSVNFNMPLNVPDFVKKICGVDSIKVEERQTVVWHSGIHFTVTSETTLENVPGASRFTTSLSLSVSEDGQQESAAAAAAAAARAAAAASSTQLGEEAAEQLVAGATAAGVAAATGATVRFSVKCSAGLPWPMSLSIENIMVEKAQVSMAGYLDFCCKLLDENLESRGRSTLHRWPTAIACSTAFNAGDLEMPLLGGDAGTPGSDVPDAFYSPRGMSDAGTPSHRSRSKARSLSNTDFHTLLEGYGSMPRGTAAAAAAEVLASGINARPMRDPVQVADLMQVVVVLQGLQQTMQRLDANVATLNTKLSVSQSQGGGVKWLLLLLLVLGAAGGLFYVFSGYRTGLLPGPPAPGPA